MDVVGNNNTKLKIEAVMSVTPLKMTEPRMVRKVVVEEGEGKKKKKKSEAYGGCYQVVLYYENVGNEEEEKEEYGWVMGGWSVESLARALSEYPLLAGRLQRREEEGEMGIMEIVTNDSGIRMVEARVYTSVSEFLQSSKIKDELEADLVFWKDIDELTPQFSPLFYVQVTNFECGGYAIGISCSLFVAEIMVVDNFLKKWAEIHNNILPRNGETKTPLFYHPRLKNPESPPSNIISRTPYKNVTQSMLFKITTDFNSECERELAMMCVEEAEKKQHKTMSHFSFFVKDNSSEVMKVEFCSKDEHHRRQELGLKSQMSSTTWDDYGVYEVAFHEGNRPVLVSRWIGSASDGNVVAVPHREKGTTTSMTANTVSALIIVTPPRP